jgi:hypothetical protein
VPGAVSVTGSLFGLVEGAQQACIPSSDVRESVCWAQDHQERSRAEQYLRVFGQSADSVSMCKVAWDAIAYALASCLTKFVAQAVLDNSHSPYAQLLASSSLIKIVTEQALR